jgi:nickel transport system substrate-binding protein
MMQVAAGLAGAAALPGTVLAAGHNVLRVAIAAEIGNLDLLQNVSPLHTYSLVFESLIRYGENGKLEPALARSWSVSEDGKTLSFELRQGVTFSDGTPFDSEAAKWNLERWMGKPDFSWIGVSDALESIATTGSHSLDIQLEREVPVALLELTIVRPVRFLSPKAVDADGNQAAPIGTGPWVITENSNAGTTLERNGSYWGEKPELERIELKVVPDELSRSNGLRAGDLDIIGGEWVAPLSPRRAGALDKSEGTTAATAPGTASVLMTLSPKSETLSDATVREAVALSIDRNSIVQIIYEGYADPTANVFPGSIPQGGKENPIVARNVDAARQKLEAAGWKASGDGWSKDGRTLSVELMVSEEALPGSRRLAELIHGQLTETGFDVSVSSVDSATIHDRRQEFTYDLTFMGTYGAPYDPHGTIANLLLSSVDSGPDGKIFMHPDLDPIVEAGLAAPAKDREAGMQAIYDWLSENSAVVPLVVPQRLWAHNDRVGNFSIPPTAYDMPVEGVVVNK